MLRDAIAFRRDARGLHIGGGRECQDQKDHAGACRDRQPVAPHELCASIGQGVAAGDHGFAVQIALDIAGHLLRGAVAALRLLAHRHQHDVVQIAAKSAAQPADGGAARFGDARGRCIGGVDCMVGKRRILFANGALDVREPHRRDDERAGAREQLIKQHSEDVDVARGGDDAALYLFRACMVRCHHANVGMGDRERVMACLPLIQ